MSSERYNIEIRLYALESSLVGIFYAGHFGHSPYSLLAHRTPKMPTVAPLHAPIERTMIGRGQLQYLIEKAYYSSTSRVMDSY